MRTSAMPFVINDMSLIATCVVSKSTYTSVYIYIHTCLEHTHYCTFCKSVAALACVPCYVLHMRIFECKLLLLHDYKSLCHGNDYTPVQSYAVTATVTQSSVTLQLRKRFSVRTCGVPMTSPPRYNAGLKCGSSSERAPENSASNLHRRGSLCSCSLYRNAVIKMYMCICVQV